MSMVGGNWYGWFSTEEIPDLAIDNSLRTGLCHNGDGEPDGLLALDPQLVCYSWITGIAEVAQVVFVRKRLGEVQYLRTTIAAEQRREFGQLVEHTIRRIESAQFLPHSGIRFPQNPCSTCPYIGLCLGKQELVDSALVRRPGAEQLGWLDELNY